jgi:hypothetical protein
MSDETPKPSPVDARLTIEADGLVVLAGGLDYFAVRARAMGGEVLTFLYQDPPDPEAPFKPRPVRRARLVIEELGELYTPDFAALPAEGEDETGWIEAPDDVDEDGYPL